METEYTMAIRKFIHLESALVCLVARCRNHGQGLRIPRLISGPSLHGDEGRDCLQANKAVYCGTNYILDNIASI